MFKKKSLTPTSLGLRIVVGGYLLYLAYSLIPAITGAPDTKEMIFWIAVVALFSCVGLITILFSVKALIKGEYDKGVQKSEDESVVDNGTDRTEEDEVKEETNQEDTNDNIEDTTESTDSEVE